jgi:hypothetical protein
MWTDYWSTLLAHWVRKEFDELGYPGSSPDSDWYSTEAEIYTLTEVTTNCQVLFHWQGYKAQQNILIPNHGPLYGFVKDKQYRIANCVFLSRFKDGDTTLFQVTNYKDVIITKDYIAYEGAQTHIIDNLEGCSLVHMNSQDYDNFLQKPIDILNKVLLLFGIKGSFK